MDEVVTHAEVLRWLPKGIGDAIERSLPPELRGWYTEVEANASPRRFVEIRNMEDWESRYIPTN